LVESTNRWEVDIRMRFKKHNFACGFFYGCETLSLTLREEKRIRMFENRMRGKVFEPKRDDETGERGRLHNEKLYNGYSTKCYSGDQIKKN
jgi:hypothetical protein